MCNTCGGKGYTEKEHGLVCTVCPDCAKGAQLAEERFPSEKPKGDIVPLRDSEYFCTKCSQPHRLSSKIGKRHNK